MSYSKINKWKSKWLGGIMSGLIQAILFERDLQQFMKGGNLAQVLAGTLSSSTIHSSNEALHQMDPSEGFAIDLLLLCDDSSQDINIRQSALVYLKNLLQRHCKEETFLPQNDLETLKASLLEALIRNVTCSKLIPTFREIVFIMAEKYYPERWSNIVEECVSILQTSSNLEGLLGAVETLKAIYSVFGGSIMKEIQLNNLSNKSILPLLTLASKLFQNFNQETAYVLVGIFKTFSTAILNSMPEIIMLNIHNLMIFVKKILDLPADLSSQENNSLFILKKISLRILFRIYQKHANPKMTQNNNDFAYRFHSSYTKPFVETLMLQVMFKDQNDRTGRHRGLDLAKLSLSTLAYINRQNKEAAALLAQYRDQVIRLCFEKFRSSLSRNYVNFTEFKIFMQENRSHFKEFVLSLLSCDALNQLQGQSSAAILSLLLDYLEKGTDQHKELALYLFTEMSTELKYLTEKVDDKMIILIQNYVKPLLAEGNHIMIRARACELICNYNYLDLPQENITELAGLVYSCMLVGKSDQEIFLKIYAVNAFNSLMKYDQIEEFVKPFIPDLLKIYTELLEADPSVIKNVQDLIDLLEEQIAPYANGLTKMLVGMFVGYTKHVPQQNYQQEQEYDEDDDEGEDEDTNNEHCARACISSIRQIMQASKTIIQEDVAQQLFEVVLWVFSDRNQDYIEEGFNVLNLLLYKKEGHFPMQYFLFFRVIAYAILGLPKSYVQQLRQKGDSHSHQYADILENVSIQPDKDLIENAIGCLRNFIAKCNNAVLHNERDQFGNSYISYIFRIVKEVHESGNQSQSNRLIVLTLYISLIEYEAVSVEELGEMVGQVERWMEMEEEVVRGGQQNGFNTFGQQQNALKYVYSPVYLQILLLSVNFYKAAQQRVNLPLVLQKTVLIQSHFQCDSELSRIIVSFGHVLDNQMVGDEQIVRGMLDILPQFVRRLCNIRQNGDSPENDFDIDDEAEEEKAFGDDENTHMLGWQGPAPSSKDMMLGGEEESEDDDWEQEFNKYYVSPLDKVEELKYLEDVLARTNNIYGPYMSQEKQQQLSLYFANAPLKLAQTA